MLILAPQPPAPSLLPQCPAARRGFTLVELLVVILIIAILASVVLFAMADAQESARGAKTRSMIAKLNTIIMPKYESYQNRKVRIDRLPTDTPGGIAFKRLKALREIMRMEMPERFTDFTQVNDVNRLPSATKAYRRFHAAASGPVSTNYQEAECLYMILRFGSDDPDAMAMFSQSDVGDVDGDGLPEFLDGWGQPISFLRWAPGYASPLQKLDNTKNYDQFDQRKVQGTASTNVAFALYPLIYSAGPDREYELRNGPNAEPTWNYKDNNDDPYISVTSASFPNGPIGKPDDANADGEIQAFDNITNHDTLVR